MRQHGREERLSLITLPLPSLRRTVRAFPVSRYYALCRLLLPVQKTLRFSQSCLHDRQQVSRGRLDYFRRTTARFTTIVLDGYGLRCHVLARPTPYASYLVLVHRLAPLLHTSFRQSLADLPLCFANPSSPSDWMEDFHPRVIEHAWHT